MNSFDVPELHLIPDPAPFDEDPSEFADFVLTALMSHESAKLFAKYSIALAVIWFVAKKQGNNWNEPVAVASSPSRGSFRSVLARFGHHYMNDQLYGGTANCMLKQRGKSFVCSISMSNSGPSGFWIEIQSEPFVTNN